ncbi:MAG: hypothetical protein ACHREM_01295 [Polyangiales bacterium]
MGTAMTPNETDYRHAVRTPIVEVTFNPADSAPIDDASLARALASSTGRLGVIGWSRKRWLHADGEARDLVWLSRPSDVVALGAKGLPLRIVATDSDALARCVAEYFGKAGLAPPPQEAAMAEIHATIVAAWRMAVLEGCDFVTWFGHDFDYAVVGSAHGVFGCDEVLKLL